MWPWESPDLSEHFWAWLFSTVNEIHLAHSSGSSVLESHSSVSWECWPDMVHSTSRREEASRRVLVGCDERQEWIKRASFGVRQSRVTLSKPCGLSEPFPGEGRELLASFFEFIPFIHRHLLCTSGITRVTVVGDPSPRKSLIHKNYLVVIVLFAA